MTTIHLGYEVGTGASVADGNWLAGLVDGEGCFSFYIRPKHRPGCYSFDFSFKVALRADDIETLRLVRTTLGVKGSLFTTQRPPDSNGKPLSAFRVQRQSEIAKVIEFFEAYRLRSKKARDFETWSKAFAYYRSAIAARTIESVSFGKINRPSASKRRPAAGTPRAKMRRTPPGVLERMQAFEKALKEGRQYK